MNARCLFQSTWPALEEVFPLDGKLGVVLLANFAQRIRNSTWDALLVKKSLEHDLSMAS